LEEIWTKSAVMWKGKSKVLFVWISISSQNVKEKENQLSSHSSVSLHKEQREVYTCHPFIFLCLSYSFDFPFLWIKEGMTINNKKILTIEDNLLLKEKMLMDWRYVSIDTRNLL
jgi:hypothetical protein